MNQREELARKIAEAVADKGYHSTCGDYSAMMIESELQELESAILPLLPEDSGWVACAEILLWYLAGHEVRPVRVRCR